MRMMPCVCVYLFETARTTSGGCCHGCFFGVVISRQKGACQARQPIQTNQLVVLLERVRDNAIAAGGADQMLEARGFATSRVTAERDRIKGSTSETTMVYAVRPEYAAAARAARGDGAAHGAPRPAAPQPPSLTAAPRRRRASSVVSRRR